MTEKLTHMSGRHAQIPQGVNRRNIQNSRYVYDKEFGTGIATKLSTLMIFGGQAVGCAGIYAGLNCNNPWLGVPLMIGGAGITSFGSFYLLEKGQQCDRDRWAAMLKQQRKEKQAQSQVQTPNTINALNQYNENIIQEWGL